MATVHGGELIVRSLVRHGVQTVFGLTGGHVHPILDAILDHDIRLIDMRHESACVLAADAYARVAGEVGVAIVTAGPGVANAVGGMATAYHAGSPVVVLAGSAPIRQADMGAIQEADQVKLVETVAKWARRVHDVSRLPEYLEMAFRHARRGRPAPVLLDIPSDVLFDRVEDAPVERPAPPAADAPLPSPSAVQAAYEVLSAAARPVVIVGSGIRWSPGGAAAVQRLAAVSGIPVLGKGLGRGTVPEDLRLGYPYELARTALPEADAVLLLGTRLNFTLNFGHPPRFDERAKFVQVDVVPEEIGHNRWIDVPIVGDTGSAANELANAFERFVQPPRPKAWLDEALLPRHERLAGVGIERSTALHPMRIARAFEKLKPANAIVVGDGANILNWGRAAIRVHEPGSWLDHAPLGSMGTGVPFGLGARAASEDLARAQSAEPRQVWVMSGDGAFGFFPMELHSAARHRLPFVVALANDGGWGADRNTQQVNFGRNSAVDFGFGRYDELARSLDCWGTLVDQPDSLEVALRTAAQQPVPALVNILTDPEAGKERRADPLLEFQLER